MTSNPTTFILFGITGDLSQKKILPALFDLYVNGRLPEGTRIVGFSRRPFSNDEIRAFARPLLEHVENGRKEKNTEYIEHFLQTLTYVQGNFDEATSYARLAEHLSMLDAERGGCTDKLFYLSVPPTLYENIARGLSESGLSIPCIRAKKGSGMSDAYTRILIEKPFGNDLETAQKLDLLLGRLFEEEQIFRIDHYLAKESLLDIVERRRNDAVLENKWNAEHIESVEINLFETATVGSRGAFYDPIGAFRDVGQNHMLQMLALVAMDIPQKEKDRKNDGKAIQKARAAVLETLEPYTEKDIQFTKRAQYDGFKAEPGVSPDSQTETFFSLPVYVAASKFKGVPFLLSSGKALKRDLTEIVVMFKDGTYKTFTVSGRDSLPAYQKILLDCIVGDQTVFTSTAEVLAEWKFVTPIVDMWKKVPLTQYKKGEEPKRIVSE